MSFPVCGVSLDFRFIDFRFLDCVAADEVPFDGTVDWRLHLVLFLKFFFGRTRRGTSLDKLRNLIDDMLDETFQIGLRSIDDLLRYSFCPEFHPADEVVPLTKKKRSVSNFRDFFFCRLGRCVVALSWRMTFTGLGYLDAGPN